ncbi:hypothetical protein CL689_00100 [Candidatus Saccharibacteria bacterium]|nr:hypothetical protein [Candidatus Saccharibacteria bacterium]MBJ58948.1 hypothetical protein [Candidatus Saccharibacteria bacterium]MBQ68453.1 hypothetical protein [Candidatus Saccharibacteria bacterium]
MYTHLSKQQRIEFGALPRAGISLRAVALLLGLNHSTLSRELRRYPSTRPNAVGQNKLLVGSSGTGKACTSVLRLFTNGSTKANENYCHSCTAARDISNRPAVVESRTRYGDWEGDTVHGKDRSGYIATFVERRSGYLVARLISKQEFGSAGFASAAKYCLASLPAKHKRTLPRAGRSTRRS